eukprot:3682995-Pyramimonas_sp.AAC.1
MRAAIKLPTEWLALLEGVEDFFTDVRGEALCRLADLPTDLFTPVWWQDRRGPARHLRDALGCCAPTCRPRNRRRTEACLRAAKRRSLAVEA